MPCGSLSITFTSGLVGGKPGLSFYMVAKKIAPQDIVQKCA